MNFGKKMLTVVYLLVAFTLTVATSKMGPHKEKLPEGITNYQVWSDCPSSLSSELISVEKNEIIDGSFNPEFYPDSSNPQKGYRSFARFGFPNYDLNVGAESRGELERSNYLCKVDSQEKRVNPEYVPTDKTYKFYEKGFLTKTYYLCYQDSNYVCSIALSEFPAGNFSDLKK